MRLCNLLEALLPVRIPQRPAVTPGSSFRHVEAHVALPSPPGLRSCCTEIATCRQRLFHPPIERLACRAVLE